jgi:predicted small lipoprotein YifL
MKKTHYLIMLLIVVFSLAACNQKEAVKEVKPSKNVVNEKTEQKPEQKQPVYQNKVFKDVTVTQTEFMVTVEGKAQVFEGVFQYGLYDNGKSILEDKYQTAGAPAWGDFKFTFEKELIKNDSKLELFVYSAKDGSKENILEIPITQ